MITSVLPLIVSGLLGAERLGEGARLERRMMDDLSRYLTLALAGACLSTQPCQTQVCVLHR